jgi:hypothetical protein
MGSTHTQNGRLNLRNIMLSDTESKRSITRRPKIFRCCCTARKALILSMVYEYESIIISVEYFEVPSPAD